MAALHHPIVLIADDDVLTLISTRNELVASGAAVLEAVDGESALSILIGHPEIEVLFTDVNMPEKDGLALSHAARTLSQTLGIIVTSGLERPATCDLPPGGVFIEKPYSITRLIELIAELAGAGLRPTPV